MSFKKEDLIKSGRAKDIERMSDLIKTKDDVVAAAKLTIGEAIEINMNELAHYTDHTYNIYPDKVEEYRQSIEDFGLMTPLIVWDKKETKSGKYEILAGHHRFEACKLLGWKKIPCILKKNITKAEADAIVNITNQLQRAFENLTIYEKAASIDQVKKAKEEIIAKHPEILEREKERIDGARSLGREFGISKSMISRFLILINAFNKKWFDYMEDTDIRKKVYTFPKMGEKAYFIAIPTSAGTGSDAGAFSGSSVEGAFSGSFSEVSLASALATGSSGEKVWETVARGWEVFFRA